MNLEKFATVPPQLRLPTDKILKADLLMQPTIEVNNFVYLREVKESSVCSRRSRLPQLWNHIPSDEAEPGYGFLTPHSHSHLPESTKAALVPSRLKMTRGKV